MVCRVSRGIAALFLATGVLFGGIAAAAEVSGLMPAQPQPAADVLQPGLAVIYYHGVFNDTREITEWAESKNGKPGEPIKMLDYWVGEGEVLTQ